MLRDGSDSPGRPARDALTVTRLNDGTYVDINSGYTFLTGYERDEVLGRSALDLPFWASPADREHFAAALTQHGHIRNFQTKFRRKDGELRTIMISAGLMMLNGEEHILAVTKDIEDLKRERRRYETASGNIGSWRKMFPI